MKKKLSVAFIGGGLNSAVGLAHFLAMKMSNKFNLSFACFSRDEITNENTAKDYGLHQECIYQDWKKMVIERRYEIDCVIILTPTNQHFDQVKFIYKLGIPIICEKTLVCSSEQAKDLERTTNESFISVVFNYICYPMMKELENKIQKGDLGKINHIRVEMPQEGFIRKRKTNGAKPQEWRLNEDNISNILLDLGSHAYSIIKFLSKQTAISTVSIMNNFGDYPGVMDDMSCIIKYTDDMVGNIWISKSALGHKNGLKITVYGSKGSALWYQMEPELLKIVDSYGTIHYLDRGSESCDIASQKRFNRFKPGHPDGFIESLSNYYDDVFEDLLSRKNQNTFGLTESKECILLLESIYKSNKEQKWSKL